MRSCNRSLTSRNGLAAIFNLLSGSTKKTRRWPAMLASAMCALLVLGFFLMEPISPTAATNNIQIVSGDTTTCALVNGGVKCWGDNNYGQLGNGSTNASSKTPVDVPGLTSGVTAIAAGTGHICAVVNGGVQCWGSNTNGQLGNNSIATSFTPVAVSELTSGVTALAAGGKHTCALVNGGVKCWGANTNGQLGDTTYAGKLTPVAVSGLTSGVTALAAGGSHTCAVVDNGAKCWGNNKYGQLGNSTTITSTTPVDVTNLGSGSGVTALVAGESHTCALVNNGAKCWGYGGWGQLGNSTTANSSSPVDVTRLTSRVHTLVAGSNHTCAVFNGAVMCWGANGSGQLGNAYISGVGVGSLYPGGVHGLDSGVAVNAFIAAGYNHTCALVNGGVKCWGANKYGQLGDGTLNDRSSPVDVVAKLNLKQGATTLASGGSYNFGMVNVGSSKALTFTIENLYPGLLNLTGSPKKVAVTGTEFMVTQDVTGSVGIGATTIFSVTFTPSKAGVLTATLTIASNDPTTPNYKLTLNGNVDGSAVPTATPKGTTSIGSIATGGEHTCALVNGGVKCWGANASGQLGNNTTTNSSSPVNVTGLTSGVTALTAGTEHTCAVVNGGVKCWGANASGQLGNKSTTNSSNPVDVPGLTSGVTTIAAGGTHTCAVVNGGVQCWGGNTNGQLGNNTTTNSSSPVNVLGLTSGVTTLAGGNSATCAVVNGKMKCWGANTSGQLGNGTTTNSSSPVDVPTLTATPSLSPTTDVSCTDSIDLMFVLDGSGSISSNDFTAMKNFVNNVLSAFTISSSGAKAGVVQFSSQGQGKVEQTLAGDALAIKAAVSAMTEIGGSTDIQEGLDLANTELTKNGRANIPKVIIFLTDGVHNQPGNPSYAAQVAKNAGSTIFAVGVGNNFNLLQLQAIASDPDKDYVLSVNSFDHLSAILAKLVKQTCAAPYVPPVSKPVTVITQTFDPNVAPSLLALDPPEGYNDAVTKVILMGDNFSTATPPTVQLVQNGQKVDLSDVVVTEIKRLTASVPKGLSVGSYDLVVTNPGGKYGTLPNGFTVLTHQPTLTKVEPAAGYNDQDQYLTLSGSSFAKDASVWLGTLQLTLTTRINASSIEATVPNGTNPGAYDVIVKNSDGTKATLAQAYTVRDSTGLNNDLFSSNAELFLDPQSPRMGEPFKLGVWVHRLGGKEALENVKVRFMRDDPVKGQKLGESTVLFLDPPSDVDATTELTATIPTTGTYTIYAIIDPDKQIPEDVETNNTVSRVIKVQPPSADKTVPVVESIILSLNGGTNTAASSPKVGVSVKATDPAPNPSGVNYVHILDYTFNNNKDAPGWTVNECSGCRKWLTYDSTNPTSNTYQLTLLPKTGVHYLQVRAVDKMGNLSIGRPQRPINYQPSADHIKRNETRPYRYELKAGEQLQVDLEVMSGDADLYVWTTGQSKWVSNLSGTVNEQVIIPAANIVAGTYQIEVFGYSAADYILNVSITKSALASSSVAATTAGGIDPNKTQLSKPVIPVDNVPSDRVDDGSPAPDAVAETTTKRSVFLPLVVR